MNIHKYRANNFMQHPFAVKSSTLKFLV